ncbi:MAG: Gfo/Idh/MocA family protein [Thermoguttaceae bacterium]
MINIGIGGLGFMGMIHFLAYKRVSGAKVRAICEQDPARLAGDWRSIKGNFGPPGKIMDLTGIARYAKLDDLLADPNLDLIDICLPPGLHARVTLDAFSAGKHVFCEKPIALNPADADRMVRTAQKAGKLLMIGHVLPFFPEFRFAYQTVTTRKYGGLLGGHFKRVISTPLWLPDFFNPATTGGPMIDLHIHDAHFIRLLCGMPRAVHTVGRMRGQVAEMFHSHFLFDDPALMITAASGVIEQQGRPFTHAYEIYLERATLLFDFAGIGNSGVLAMPVTVLGEQGRVLRPKLGSGDPVDAFVAELGEVVRCIRNGKPSAVLDGQLARDALLLCHRQTQSLVKRKTVKV